MTKFFGCAALGTVIFAFAAANAGAAAVKPVNAGAVALADAASKKTPKDGPEKTPVVFTGTVPQAIEGKFARDSKGRCFTAEAGKYDYNVEIPCPKAFE